MGESTRRVEVVSGTTIIAVSGPINIAAGFLWSAGKA